MCTFLRGIFLFFVAWIDRLSYNYNYFNFKDHAFNVGNETQRKLSKSSRSHFSHSKNAPNFSLQWNRAHVFFLLILLLNRTFTTQFYSTIQQFAYFGFVYVLNRTLNFFCVAPRITIIMYSMVCLEKRLAIFPDHSCADAPIYLFLLFHCRVCASFAQLNEIMTMCYH